MGIFSSMVDIREKDKLNRANKVKVSDVTDTRVYNEGKVDKLLDKSLVCKGVKIDEDKKKELEINEKYVRVRDNIIGKTVINDTRDVSEVEVDKGSRIKDSIETQICDLVQGKEWNAGSKERFEVDRLLKGLDSYEELTKIAFKRSCMQFLRGIRPVPVKFGSKSCNSVKGRVLFYRNGGIGDILMISSAIREYKRVYPDRRLYFVGPVGDVDILKHNPNFNELYDYKDYIDLDCFDELVDCSGITDVVDDKYEDGIRGFGAVIGVQEFIRVKPTLYVKSAEITKWKQLKSKKTVTVTFSTTTHRREWPIDNWHELMGWLLDKGWKVVLVDKRLWQLPDSLSKVVNLCGKTTIRDVVGIVKNSNLVICPDTSLTHIAGASNVPFIGLYGMVHPDRRLKCYKNCVGLWKGAHCYPCDGQGSLCKFRDIDGIWAECMRNIKVTDVVEALVKVVR